MRSLSLIAFRFVFVTVVLATGHLSGLLTKFLYFGPIIQAVNTVVRPAQFWVIDSLTELGVRVLGADFSLTSEPYATRAALVATSYFLAVTMTATAITAAWTLLDRRRTHYAALHGWTQLYARYLLAVVLMGYAVAKVVPTQFGFLPPGELLRQVGHLPRSDVLWTFMSVSTGYTVFTGMIELAGAILLFYRRTALLGALVSCVALTQVVALDTAFNVSGPLLTAIFLLVLTLVVLLPYLPALAAVLLFQRAANPPPQPSPRFGWTSSRYWAAAKTILLAYLLVPLFAVGVEQRRSFFGAGRPVWGLFDVEAFARTEESPPGVPGEGETWRRVGSAGRMDSGGLIVQFADGGIRQFRLEDDTANQRWTIRSARSSAGGPGAELFALLQYHSQADGTVVLEGHIGQRSVTMRLRRVEPSQYPLLENR
jgi:hypothetical protein